MVNLKFVPCFRLLVPYVIGIGGALYFGMFKSVHVCFLLSALLLGVSFMFQKSKSPVTILKKRFYTFFVILFLLMAAFESCYFYDARNDPFHYSHLVHPGKQSITGTINDLPVVSEQFTKLSLDISCIESNGQWHYATGNIVVYLKNGASKKPALGDHILLNTTLLVPQEPKNPGEFHYKQYLEYKNRFHLANVSSQQLHAIPNGTHPFSLTLMGARWKAYVVSILRQSGLSKDAFSIASALLVGYDDEIDPDIMTSFSHSGTLHILSVSGMHTALLYGIILFFFSFIDPQEKMKYLKCFTIISCLLLFVLITGFSPSVLRAVTMLILMTLGKTFYKQGNSYNTLFLSAFLLLLYNPYFILDTGFLLSYTAVFGIMYLYPILDSLFYVHNKIVRWCWSLCLMSVSATLFTLPITLYFFHQFAIWFIVSNLVVIPISLVLMGAAIALVTLHKVMLIQQVLVFLMNAFTSLMLWFTKLTDHPKYGFMDYISFDGYDVVCCLLLITSGLALLHSRSYRSVMTSGIILLIWISVSIFDNFIALGKKEFVVFHVKHKTAFGLRLGKTMYTHFEGLTEKEFQRFIKPYLLTIPGIRLVTTRASFWKYNKFLLIANCSEKDVAGGLNPECIMVSQDIWVNFRADYKIKPLIIADCSNSYTFVKNLKNECEKRHLPFYSVKEEGALNLKPGP